MKVQLLTTLSEWFLVFEDSNGNRVEVPISESKKQELDAIGLGELSLEFYNK